MERLTIENYAGIKELDLEVKPFTVLIGPQSVGKSITAKLLYFFKSLPREAYAAGMNSDPPKLEHLAIKVLGNLLPDATHSGTKWSITYAFGNEKLRLVHSVNGSNNFRVHCPESFVNAYANFVNDWKEARLLQKQDIDADLLTPGLVAEKRYLDSITKIFPGRFLSIFVPAGRSYYAQIERDFASYFQNATVDPFVSQFASALSRFKEVNRSVLAKKDQASVQVHNLFEHLLGGRYERQGGKDFIHVSDGRKLPSNLWSSGQQEAHSLAYILLTICCGYYPNSELVIEEPEAHLFPSYQREMIELVALAFNLTKAEMGVFLTTHSPYVLTTVNNLLLAGQQYERELSSTKEKSLEKIIPRNVTLSPGKVGAYYMTRDECKSIIEPETGLIDASAIDDVSGEIAEQFDALLEFEHR